MQTQIWLLEVLETLSPEDWALSEDMDRSLRFLLTVPAVRRSGKGGM